MDAKEPPRPRRFRTRIASHQAVQSGPMAASFNSLRVRCGEKGSWQSDLTHADEQVWKGNDLAKV